MNVPHREPHPHPRAAELLWMLDHSFDGDEEHSLLANLRNVRARDWTQAPPQGERTIAAIATHAGVAIELYAEHLHGDADSTYESVLSEAHANVDLADRGATIEWLRASHAFMRDAVLALTDADLDVVTRVHWGGRRPRRRQIATIIVHNTYHAGEINHLRALLQHDDAWFSDREAGSEEATDER